MLLRSFHVRFDCQSSSLQTIPSVSLIDSPRFMSIASLLNSVILDLEPDCPNDLPFVGKASQSSEELSLLLADRTAQIDSLEVKVRNL